MTELSPLLSQTLTIVLGILSVAFILSLLRLIKGPSIPDRVVAIDLLSTVFMGIIVLFLLSHAQPVFLDVIGTLALIAFLGTISFARHLEKEGSHE